MAKSYKREVALAILAFTLGMFTWHVATGNQNAFKVADRVFDWAMLLTVAAFGFDAVTKQLLPMIRGGR